MNRAQMKQMLYEHPYARQTIDELNAKIAELRHIKYDTSVSAKISGAPTSGSISRPTENAAVKICEFYDAEMWRITREIQKVLERQRTLDIALGWLTQRGRYIIRLRYFHKVDWDHLAALVGLTKRQCRRIHDKAIEELCTRFSKDNVSH